MSVRSYIVDDREKKTFLLDREVLVSEDVLRAEMAQHLRQVLDLCRPRLRAEEAGRFPHPQGRRPAGDLLPRPARRRSTACSTPAATAARMVCTEREGNRAPLPLHLSRLDLRQRRPLVGVPGDDAYADELRQEHFGLRRPARFEEYRGFWFMNLDADAPSLADYLAGAKDYIDLVIDQSPSGQMEIIAGMQEYDVNANWKLMVENSVDDYHLPSTHSTWLNFMANSGVKIEPPKEDGLVLPTHGLAVELGNGHFTTDNINFRGRPVAKWIPLYGEAAKAEIDGDPRASWSQRLGPERAKRVADTNRNLVIFPNLVINDGSSVTVRTFYPDGADKMHVTAWALGPVEESESARARRLDAFLTFYGPGGFATPDDVEALELVQQGLANWHEDRWSEMSRGMGKEGEQLNSDEHHLRIFWRRWNELMGARA